MADVWPTCIFFTCRSNAKLLHIVGLKATILTYLLSVLVVSVKSHISTRSHNFRRNPEIQDYKILKQYRIASLSCKAFQTIKFLITKKILQQMQRRRWFQRLCASWRNAPSHSSQLDYIIRRHLRPEKRINRRQMHSQRPHIRGTLELSTPHRRTPS